MTFPFVERYGCFIPSKEPGHKPVKSNEAKFDLSQYLLLSLQNGLIDQKYVTYLRNKYPAIGKRERRLYDKITHDEQMIPIVLLPTTTRTKTCAR